jgi:hypothetical protein
MDALTGFIVDGVSWGRTVVGLMLRPYETYRRITDRGRIGELGYIALISALYFMLASMVKVAAFRPFLLSRQFMLLAFGAASCYVVAFGALAVAGRIIHTKVKLSTLALAWGYTLLPTVMWFFMTSLLYVILPPPRTTSTMGIMFSVLFLICSATLLWWKIMLAYLTIRFTMKVDFSRILIISAVVIPVIAVYSILMYRWGIFKVPFL